MYRIWLLSVLYGPRRFVPGMCDSEEDYRDRESDLHKSWKDQKIFLERFSSQELFQIRQLNGFLGLTAGWAVTAEGRGLGGTRETCRFWTYFS
jgi:hypothetical protein